MDNNNIRIIDTLVSNQSTAHSQKMDLVESKQYQYLKEELIQDRMRHSQESQEWGEE